MRVLLGGIIGAGAAAVAWMAIEHSTKQEFNWMAIVAGLIIGLAVYCASKSKSRSSFGRGFLAVVLTLVVCVGSRQAYAKYMERSGMGESAKLADAAAGTGDADETETGSEQSGQPAELAVSSELPMGSGAPGFGKASFKQGFSEWDMLWLSVAALTAYVTGKGRDRAPAAEAESSEPEEAEPA